MCFITLRICVEELTREFKLENNLCNDAINKIRKINERKTIIKERRKIITK